VGTAVQKREAFLTLKDLLEKNKAGIEAALPKHMNADRMLRVALTATRTTPKLLQCDPKSVVEHILTVSQLGLEPNDVRGQAYLIPFNNRKKGTVDCQLIIGYKGFVELARRSGLVSTVNAFIVYDKEPFNYKAGSFPSLEHQPLAPSARGDKKIGVYAVMVLKDGTSQFAFLWADEVEGLRKRSKAADDGPWKTDEEEMWKKSAIRRLGKLMPLSPEWNQAVAIDEYQEAGVKTDTGEFTFDDDPEPEALEATVQPAEEEKKEEDRKDPEPQKEEPKKEEPPKKEEEKKAEPKKEEERKGIPEDCPHEALSKGNKPCPHHSYGPVNQLCDGKYPCLFPAGKKG
jgi:recombination protein RecT